MAEKPRNETVTVTVPEEPVAVPVEPVAEGSHTVKFLSAPSGAPADVVRVDDVELTKGEPVDGLTDDQVARLQALPGLRFQVDDQIKER